MENLSVCLRGCFMFHKPQQLSHMHLSCVCTDISAVKKRRKLLDKLTVCASDEGLLDSPSDQKPSSSSGSVVRMREFLEHCLSPCVGKRCERHTEGKPALSS